MIEFLVTIACAVGVRCPLEKPVSTPLAAKDQHECHSRVTALMAAYHYDPRNFVVKCDKK